MKEAAWCNEYPACHEIQLEDLKFQGTDGQEIMEELKLGFENGLGSKSAKKKKRLHEYVLLKPAKW